MSRSFRIVEYKIVETDFFLEQLKQSTYDPVPIHASEYLSAFLASSRSITFVLQASLSQFPNFQNWYEVHQQNLRQNKLSKFFLEARNLSQKVGYYPLTSFEYYLDDKGQKRMRYYFDEKEKTLEEYIPKEDIITACTKYFQVLLEVVYDSFQFFGTLIDPEQIFNLNHLRRTGKTIEDVEVELGFSKGYSGNNDNSDEERLNLLAKEKRKFYHDNIDSYLVKHIGKTRTGVVINK